MVRGRAPGPRAVTNKKQGRLILMSLAEILEARVSTRAFLDKPVPDAVLQKVFADAQMAPSNCNTQPWHTYVVSGAAKQRLSDKLVAAVMSGSGPSPEFDWIARYEGVHRERQVDAAFVLYDAMGIERMDKPARQVAMLRNWQFFDAPHAAIFTMDKYLGIMGAVDMGIYAQTIALLLQEQGISSCMQGALGQFPGPIRETFELPEERGVLFGMSFGYADPEAAANQGQIGRAGLEESVRFLAE